MYVVCAACGADLTVAREFYNNASVLRPLEGIEVMPCCSCMSRAASEGLGLVVAEDCGSIEDVVTIEPSAMYAEPLVEPIMGAAAIRASRNLLDMAALAMENDEHQRESAENGGLGR